MTLLVYNRKKHKLLKKLSDLFLNRADEGIVTPQADEVGLSFEEIESFLNIDKRQREIILSGLVKCEEIFIFDLEHKGCSITDKNGLSAVLDKKYLKLNEDIFLKGIKFFVQILVPILSLSIALIAMTLRFKSFNENIEHKVSEKYKQKLILIESKLDSILLLENNRKNNTNTLRSKP